MMAALVPAACADGLTINFLNYAGLEPEVIEVAVETASFVLGHAGVESAWCEWQPRIQERSCRPSRFHLLLVPADMRKKLQLEGEALGMALMAKDGVTGDTAYVFADRIAYITRANPGATGHNLARVLGHVMVHELGHLLLGAGNHRPQSIMTARWGVSELKWALQGGLLFCSDHANKIRNAASAVEPALSASSSQTSSSRPSSVSSAVQPDAERRCGEHLCAPPATDSNAAPSSSETPSQRATS